jgi:hypothetical protein
MCAEVGVGVRVRVGEVAEVIVVLKGESESKHIVSQATVLLTVVGIFGLSFFSIGDVRATAGPAGATLRATESERERQRETERQRDRETEGERTLVENITGFKPRS